MRAKIILCALLINTALLAQGQQNVSIVGRIDNSLPSTNYISNRAPLMPEQLIWTVRCAPCTECTKSHNSRNYRTCANGHSQAKNFGIPNV